MTEREAAVSSDGLAKHFSNNEFYVEVMTRELMTPSQHERMKKVSDSPVKASMQRRKNTQLQARKHSKISLSIRT